jgi:hypothetical protein
MGEALISYITSSMGEALISYITSSMGEALISYITSSMSWLEEYLQRCNVIKASPIEDVMYEIKASPIEDVMYVIKASPIEDVMYEIKARFSVFTLNKLSVLFRHILHYAFTNYTFCCFGMFIRFGTIIFFILCLKILSLKCFSKTM